MGSLKCFLNIEVIRDRTQHKNWLKQSQYTADILFDFAMSDCNPVRNPEIPNTRLHSGQSPQSDLERDKMSKKPYREAVGSLIYLATKTRPDIIHAVQQVAQFCEEPGLQHWFAVKRIFAYLKGTQNYGLEFTGNFKFITSLFQ